MTHQIHSRRLNYETAVVHIDKLSQREGPWTRSAACAATHLTTKGFGLLLLKCEFLPWVRVQQDENGYVFTIDTRLRMICELSQSDHRLPARSLGDFFYSLRAEIAKRRRDGASARKQRRWNPDGIIKAELIELIQWIEDELDKVHAVIPPSAGRPDSNGLHGQGG